MIHSLLTARFAVQVSDRRLTEDIAANQFDTWDPASNKSVVLLGRDGLIAMGYGGTGFIGSATTDGSIAETITGLSMGANLDRRDFALRSGDALPDKRFVRISRQSRTVSIGPSVLGRSTRMS